MEQVMNEDQFSVLLGVSIVPAIFEALGVDGTTDIDRFYQSKLYALLGDPATGMWHLSPALLAQLYNEELEAGSFEIPEEQS
jgi:hypothetical protein